MGAAFSLIFPSLALLVVNRVPEDRRGVAMGTFTACFDLGVGLGAPIAGAAAALGGYGAAFARRRRRGPRSERRSRSPWVAGSWRRWPRSEPTPLRPGRVAASGPRIAARARGHALRAVRTGSLRVGAGSRCDSPTALAPSRRRSSIEPARTPALRRPRSSIRAIRSRSGFGRNAPPAYSSLVASEQVRPVAADPVEEDLLDLALQVQAEPADARRAGLGAERAGSPRPARASR